jgi:hypothetical protein
MSQEAADQAALAQLERMAGPEAQAEVAPTPSEVAAMEAAVAAQAGQMGAEGEGEASGVADLAAAVAASQKEDTPLEPQGTEAEETEAAARAALAALAAEEAKDAAPEPEPATAADAAADAPEPESIDPFSIGNELAILSSEYGYVIGRVIYRDEKLIRLMRREVSDRAVEFPLVAGGSEFAPGLGVMEVTVVDIDPYQYYVDFLHVKVGDHLEFFDTRGKKAREPGEVAEIIKSRTKDSIRLTDGTVLKFRGRGPEAPIAVIRVVSEPAALAAAAEEGVPEAESTAATLRTQAEMMELLRAAIPAGAAELVGAGEQGYPDSLQREDLFQDLMERVSAKQKTNPRRIRAIDREVDMAMSLKNKTIRRDEAGNVIGPVQTEVNTFADISRPLPSLVPIVNAALVLNLDEVEPELAYKATDIMPRSLSEVENASEQQAVSYEEDREGMDFGSYILDLTGRDGIALSGPKPVSWQEDQDIVRTAGYEAPVQTLSIDRDSYKADESVISLAQIASNTAARTTRVLMEDRHTYRSRSILLAPSDPSVITGFATLPTKAALTLRPPKRPGHLPTALLYSAALQDDNLPTVAAALRDLYVPEPSSLNSYTLDAATAAGTDLAEWLRTALKYAAHPVDSLGPRGPRLLAVLDSIGLGDADMSPAVSEVVWSWVQGAQRQWRNLLNEERRRIQGVLDAQPAATYQTVTGDDSPTWDVLREAATLKEIIEDITRRNPAIVEAPTVLTAGLLMEAQGDATPLVWSALARYDGRELAIDDVAASASLAASRAYALRRKALRDIGLLQLSATPEINTCPHVKQLEAVRNLKDVPQRARLLRDFIEEYQGGRNGDWVTCVVCRQDCVCYHEIMELEALAQPLRMDSILKQLVVRFGGARFEGKIICKNCGQGLQDIDYDDQEEFDDDGRVIQSRSVLTEDQMAEEPTEVSWRQAAEVLKKDRIDWGGNKHQEHLADILQTVADRGNLQIPDSVVRSIVQRAEVYVDARKPTQTAYEGDLRKVATLAAKSGKVAPKAPTYSQVLGQLRLAAIMALTTIALQAADPPVLVTNPLHTCPYSRGGWPLDQSADPIKTDKSALLYIACVVAGIQNDQEPWGTLLWAAERDLDRRKMIVKDIVFKALKVMVGEDPKVPSGMPFTVEVLTELEAMRSNAEAKVAREMVSAKDQLPAAFRPLPTIIDQPRPSGERDPLPNIDAALAAGRDVEPVVGPVASALARQAIAIVGELHTQAKEGVRGPTNTTDSVCCAVSLADAEAGALLGNPEMANLVKAGTLLRHAIPTAPVAGTHLWSDFRVPEPAPIDEAVDPGVLYKLFLKYCYTGPQIGEPHEFSTGNICRQCGLRLGKPLDLIDFGKEGAAILAAQGGELRVEAVTQATFDALSDVVRRRKIMTQKPTIVQPPWWSGLQLLIATTNARTDLLAGQGAKAPAEALRIVLLDLSGREMEPVGEADRIGIWEPVTQLMDALRGEVEVHIGLASKDKKLRRAAEIALETLDRMTEDPFIEGPRAVQEYWCAKTEAGGNAYGIHNTRGARWSAISRQHNERINDILQKNSDWEGSEVLDEMRPVLRRVGQALGPIMRAWQRAVRPGPETGPWTAEVARSVLRCFVLQIWRDALMGSSWAYRGIDSPAVREAITGQMAIWTRGLMRHAGHQFIRYSKERIQQILQQRAELERNTVVEEFKAIKDDDLRVAYNIAKQLKIGRWGRGFKLDADQFEFEAQQRQKMGIDAPEAPVDPTLLGAAAAVAAVGEDFGLGGGGQDEAGYEVEQGAAGDDY